MGQAKLDPCSRTLGLWPSVRCEYDQWPKATGLTNLGLAEGQPSYSPIKYCSIEGYDGPKAHHIPA